MDGRAKAEMIGSIANFGSAIDSPMMLCPWPHHYGKELEGVTGVVATLKGSNDGSPQQEAKILQCHFTHVNKFLFDCHYILHHVTL